LLDDPTLDNLVLDFENFGPNAVTVKPSKKVDGLFLNDAGLKAMARLVPGDRIVMGEHSIGVDFLAAAILDDPGAVLSDETLERYRLIPS
jgi:hypothetical protein